MLASDIRVGQKWQDRDKRMIDRIMLVRVVNATYVVMVHPTMENIRTRVRVDNLRRRWKLVR